MADEKRSFRRSDSNKLIESQKPERDAAKRDADLLAAQNKAAASAKAQEAIQKRMATEQSQQPQAQPQKQQVEDFDFDFDVKNDISTIAAATELQLDAVSLSNDLLDDIKALSQDTVEAVLLNNEDIAQRMEAASVEIQEWLSLIHDETKENVKATKEKEIPQAQPQITPTAAQPPEKLKDAPTKSSKDNPVLKTLNDIKAGISGMSSSLFSIATGFALQSAKMALLLGAAVLGIAVLNNIIRSLWNKYQEDIKAAWNTAKETFEAIKKWFDEGPGKDIKDALTTFVKELKDGNIKKAFIELFKDAGQILNDGLLRGFESIMRAIPGLGGAADKLKNERIADALDDGRSVTDEDKEFYNQYNNVDNSKTKVEQNPNDPMIALNKGVLESRMLAIKLKEKNIPTSPSEAKKAGKFTEREEIRKSIKATATDEENTRLREKVLVTEPELDPFNYNADEKQARGDIRNTLRKIDTYGPTPVEVEKLKEQKKVFDGLGIKDESIETRVNNVLAGNTKKVTQVNSTDNTTSDTATSMANLNSNKQEINQNTMNQQIVNNQSSQTLIAPTRAYSNRFTFMNA